MFAVPAFGLDKEGAAHPSTQAVYSIAVYNSNWYLYYMDTFNEVLELSIAAMKITPVSVSSSGSALSSRK